MRHLLLILLLLLRAMSISAQDVIINKEGDALKVYGLEIGNSALFYRESQASDAPIKRIEKKDVLMVKYQDGRKEVIGENNPSPTSTSQNAVAVNSVSANAINSERIAAYNSGNVRWLETPKPKDDYIFSYCRLKVKEGSILESDEISISLKTGELDKNGQYSSSQSNNIQVMTFVVHNKTGKSIFIDLGNTFFVRGSEAEPYYIPTATSEYRGRTIGSGINLGAVASALGISGSVGTLANGINLSESNISGTKTTVYSQRILSIPPNSSKTLTPKMIIPIGFSSIPWVMVREKEILSCINDYRQGDIAHWNATDSPLSFSFFLSFAYDETCANLQMMKVDMYLSDMYAIYLRGGHMWKSMEGHLDNWREPLHFLKWNITNLPGYSKSLKNKIISSKSELGGSWESVAK